MYATTEVTWTAEEVSRLIDAVRQRETLYNTTSAEYRNKTAMSQCWTEVAKIVGGGKTEIYCREKWNVLRSVYRRQRRNMELGNAVSSSRRTNWRWTDRMSFLHEFFTLPMGRRSTACNLPSSSEMRSPATTPPVVPSEAADEDFERSASPAPIPCAPPAPPTVQAPVNDRWGARVEPPLSPEWRDNRRRRGESKRFVLMQELRDLMRVKRTDEDVDPFFLSVTRGMRKLSDKDQSLFKIQVQTILHEFLYPSE